MHTPTKRTSHSVYNLNDHLVFVTTYRHCVLTGRIADHVKTTIPTVCQRYGWEPLALEVMPDHVHLFLSAPPVTAPVTIGKTVKSILAVDVFRTFPTLKQRYFWGSGLWTDGCYYGSAGTVSAHTIALYIANQKEAER
jgi:putative transposase